LGLALLWRSLLGLLCLGLLCLGLLHRRLLGLCLLCLLRFGSPSWRRCERKSVDVLARVRLAALEQGPHLAEPKSGLELVLRHVLEGGPVAAPFQLIAKRQLRELLVGGLFAGGVAG